MNEKIFILILIIIFVIFSAVILYLEMKEDFICDIGKNDTMGDYKVLPPSFFNQRWCAVKDCNAYNIYWEKNCKERECPICAV